VLRTKCPKCGEKVAVHPAMAGKPVKCPGCNTEFKTGGTGHRVATDDFTGVVEVGAKATAKKGDAPKVDSKVILLIVLILGAVAAAVYFLVLSG
jgi:hypothetical protein